MNIDDLRMGTIIKDGSDGEVVLVGAPFSFARLRCIKKSGQDLGPCCLRRFFGRVGPIVNPEYGISVQKVKVSDYGNIQFKGDRNSMNAAEECIQTISAEIGSLLEKGGIPIVLGGSKEVLFGCASAFHNKYGKESKHILISGKPNLGKLGEGNMITSQNALTLLKTCFPNSVTLFAAHQKHFSIDNLSKNIKKVTYEQIRKHEYTQNSKTYTQAGSIFHSLLQKTQGPLHVSLTVDAIQLFRGCRDLSASGLSVQQIIQIFLLLGRCERVRLIDINEFNPSVEQYESCLLLANCIYYYLLGFASRSPS